MVNEYWTDSPSSMFPVYKRLINYGLLILIYSGDMDAVVPVTSTRYSLEAFNLKILKPWNFWLDDTGYESSSSVLAELWTKPNSYGGNGYDPLGKLIEEQKSSEKAFHLDNNILQNEYFPVYIGPQDGLKEADKILALPGQPEGESLNQYSGYVTVDPTAGRALFYYFVESQDSSSKPLVLWLNGGPGCSSIGSGAMMELGPYRVNSDRKTLSKNKFAWNNEKFPEYKTRDFFIAGESYAGHYEPQFAQLVLHNNINTSQTVINLKGIATHVKLLAIKQKLAKYLFMMYMLIYVPRLQAVLHRININIDWLDKPLTVLPVIKELMSSGIRVWIYSGDTDGIIPVTSSRYAIDKLQTSVRTPWYPWVTQGEVGGYAVGYENLTFVTIRGSGHFVPSYQPSCALSFFTSFLEEKLPPSQ
ncbi:hypothetical protein AgCh_024957 [Apium graveolens]